MQVRPLPWQGFPGIFSSIDRYTKQVVVGHLQREGRLPPWMAPALYTDGGEVVEHLNPPHWSKFKATDETTGVTVRGEADAIFRLADGSCSSWTTRPPATTRTTAASTASTARSSTPMPGSPSDSTSRRSPVWPSHTWNPPPTRKQWTWQARQMLVASPSVSAPDVVEVELNPQRLIPPLLRQAARIHALAEPPQGADGCRDCAALEGLLKALGRY